MDITSMSSEQARAWVREILGPPTREITGAEYDELMLIFALLEPVSVSNNQRTETVVYNYHEQEYHVTYGLAEYPTIEVVIAD